MEKYKAVNHDNNEQEGRAGRKTSTWKKLAIAGCHLGEIFSLVTVLHAGLGLYSGYVKDLSMWQEKKYSHEEISQVDGQCQNCNSVLLLTVFTFSAAAGIFKSMQNKLKENKGPSP
ncbi:MAG: hypothetical protein VX737_01250 [Pseudomonadota bacterium]|nr:hypothetical protein [Pseudomonadota bacterium]